MRDLLTKYKDNGNKIDHLLCKKRKLFKSLLQQQYQQCQTLLNLIRFRSITVTRKKKNSINIIVSDILISLKEKEVLLKKICPCQFVNILMIIKSQVNFFVFFQLIVVCNFD